MNNTRKNILAALAIGLVTLLAAATVYVSYKLSSGQPIIPTAPAGSQASCTARCPDSRQPTLLHSCTPSADGTYESLCNVAGRVETCGGGQYCCPSPGATWTTSMTACAAPTATVAPTATPAVVLSNECEACGGDSGKTCATGLTCDTTDGRCKKADGSSICYETSSECSATAKAICVPTSTITCNPDCPTDCGLAASTITTCTNSCGVAVTKSCPATEACGTVDISITNKAFKFNTTTLITSVAKNQTFTYATYITNNGNKNATGVEITDTLDGDNQDLLTFVNADSGCTYSATDRKVSCRDISLNAGATKAYSFRVKLTGSAVNGENIVNSAEVNYNGNNKSADYSLAINTPVGCNQTCTTSANCTTGLVCDADSGTCRKAACTDVSTCVCPTAVVTASPTATVTTTITATITATVTAAAPTEIGVTETAAQPTTLPETGILNLPGVAAFGGGLMLAIVGILLAL